MPLTVETDGATATVRRRFEAPPERVWAAHTEPELIRRWLSGYDGWTMTECVNEAREGGAIRYAWKETATGNGFHLTGEVLTLEPPHRMVHVERMFLPDPTPDNRVETRFEPDGSGTLLTMTMTVPSAEILEQMLATGMTDGMEHSYARLDDELLAA